MNRSVSVVVAGLLAGVLSSGCVEAPAQVGENQSAICYEPPDCPPCYHNSGFGGCFCARNACSTSLPNETATCDPDTEACVAQCRAGFGDCDGVSANGCEVSLTSDVNNCGACGHVCSASAGNLATCTNGICGTVNACSGTNNPCGVGGVCNAISGGGWTCSCSTGYVSTDGSTPSCVDLNACTAAAIADCAATPGSACVDEPPPSTGYHCQCDAGSRACNGVCIPLTACCVDSDCVPPANGSALCVNHSCYAACNNGSAPMCY